MALRPELVSPKKPKKEFLSPKKVTSGPEAILTRHEISFASSGDCPEDNDGWDDWTVDTFKKRFQLNVVKYDKEEDVIEFDLIYYHSSIANALRRIILSLVPSMAIDKVRMYNNTSILQDEFLAHRLGLIPIRADPRLFHYKMKRPDWLKPPEGPDFDNPLECLIFSLRVKRSSQVATKTPSSPTKRRSSSKTSADSDSEDPMTEVKDGRVMSSMIKWVPLPGQEEHLQGNLPRVVHNDILVARLNPKQEIDVKLVVVKGVGEDHAKFSPVCTASYRLMPIVEIVKPVGGEAAQRLKESFSKGVIEIDKKGFAYVADARKDHLSRNHLRYDDLTDAVKVGLKKDHFIFTIESSGSRNNRDIMIDACDILIEKCNKYLEEVQVMRQEGEF